MTESGNGQPTRFKVDFLGGIGPTIRQLKKQATSQGKRADFVRAMKIIMQRLASNPAEFGELIRRHPVMELYDHVGTVPPVRVEFGYHLDPPFVIIKKVALMG